MADKNTQIFCSKCDVLLDDPRANIHKDRHSAHTVFGYSASGTWGLRRDAFTFDSQEGLCNNCFMEWWELAMKFREWAGLMPIEPDKG